MKKLDSLGSFFHLSYYKFLEYIRVWTDIQMNLAYFHFIIDNCLDYVLPANIAVLKIRIPFIAFKIRIPFIAP